MNEQELLRLFEMAKAALDDGGSMVEINQIIREQTENQFAGIMTLGMFIGPEALEGTSEAQIGEMVRAESDHGPVDKSSAEIFAELKQDPKNKGLRQRFKDRLVHERNQEFGSRDIAESFLQTLSFGTADDILGEEFATRLEKRREEHPFASLAAEGLGLLVPGTAVAKGALLLARGARGLQAARAARAVEAGVRAAEKARRLGQGSTRISRAAQGARVAKAGRTALAASGEGRTAAGIFRGASTLAVGTGLESAALAAGEAEFRQPEGSVGPPERGVAAAKGFAIGAPFGAAAGVAGPVLRGAGRLLRSDAQLANIVAKDAVEQTGRSVDDLFDAVRARKNLLGGDPATLGDVAPELGIQAERLAAGGTGVLRRPGGPLEALRLRVTSDVVEKAKRTIYAPFDGLVFDDPHLIAMLTKSKTDVNGVVQNAQILDATREVMRGALDKVTEVKFKQLQSIRNRLHAQFKRATSGGFIDEASNVKEVQLHLDETMENLIPGYRAANTEFIEFASRMDGQEELIRAIDKALPTLVPEVPSFGGIFASTYKTVGRPAARRRAIMEIVAEALLADGEEGIARLTLLLRQGKIAQLFSGLNKARSVGSKALRAQPGGLINPDRFE